MCLALPVTQLGDSFLHNHCRLRVFIAKGSDRCARPEETGRRDGEAFSLRGGIMTRVMLVTIMH